MQINFNNYKSQLTEKDIDQIVHILGYRCRVRTCQRLRSALTYSASMIKSFGILERLIKEGDSWKYCAGQSYTDELKTIRDAILK